MKFLSKQQIEFYHQNGYLVVEQYLSASDIIALKNGAKAIIEQFDLSELKVFTTENQIEHLDRYFLESGDKVRCFFEKDAFDEAGKLVWNKTEAVNKIGHAMHDLMPHFERISYRKVLLSIVQALGLKVPSIVQSQYIYKSPKIGGAVNPHTDSTFIYTEPLSCLGAWMALDDATVKNGCLRIIPGSHLYPLQQQYVRNEEGNGTKFVDTPDSRVMWPLEELIPVEVKAGDLVLLHGSVVHSSEANHSDFARHAYVLHLVDLETSWPKDNWLQRPRQLPFRTLKNVIEILN